MLVSVLVAFLCLGGSSAAPPVATAPPNSNEAVDPESLSYPVPEIDWGECPQLKPTEADKEQKRHVIQVCLEENPPPALESVSDPKQIDEHREIVTTCALKKEGWFNEDGTYKFDKARKEIESKKMTKEIEKNITTKHQECEEEAIRRFPGGFIQQVQLYQACMDYHIADICQIKLIEYYDEFPPHPEQPEDKPPTVSNSNRGVQNQPQAQPQPQPARAN